MTSRGIRLRIWAVAAIVVACGTPAALADGFVDPEQACAQPLQQTFLAWGDEAGYFAVPGGSFALAPGGSTTTGPVCVTSASPTIRAFVGNDGSRGARLRIEAVLENRSGRVAPLAVATIGGGTVSAPSAPLRLLLRAIDAVSGGTPAGVSFRFTAVTGSWRVDGVYVDPIKDCC